jgi:hypothetical protein
MRTNTTLALLLVSAALLLLPDTQSRSAIAATTDIVTASSTIDTVFGNGAQLPFSPSDVGKPATQVPLSNSLQSGMVVAPDGTIYVTMPRRVVKVGPDGIVRPVVGFCTTEHPRYPACITDSTGDGGPALQATVSSDVQGLSLGPDGSLYIGDRYRVRKIGPDGIITTVACTGQDGFSGDGGPALSATFGSGNFFIGDVDVAPDGSIYITDTGNYRIRKVDPSGIVTTVAGRGGNPPNCWEIPASGAATEVFLSFPRTVTLGPDGALYVSSTNCATLRRVAGGTSSIAVEGFDGDRNGTPFSVNQANGVTFGLDSTLYLTNYFSNADNVLLARAPGSTATVLNPDNIVAGRVANGWRFSGDGGPARDAELAAPSTLATGPDGSIYVLDALNYRIRRLSPQYSGAISPTAPCVLIWSGTDRLREIRFTQGVRSSNGDREQPSHPPRPPHTDGRRATCHPRRV